MLVKGVFIVFRHRASLDRSQHSTAVLKPGNFSNQVEIIWLQFLLFKRAAESMMKVNFIDPLPPKLREDTAKISAA